MAQGYLGQIPADPAPFDGEDLAAAWNAFDTAVKSGQSGATRPAGIVAGGIWVRANVGGTYTLMLYDGATDIEIVSLPSLTAALAAGTSKRAIVWDQKTSGDAGGTFTSGAARVRDLNQLDSNITGLSLASNQITVPAGAYVVRGSAPAYSVTAHQAWLYDVTNDVDLAMGSSEVSSSTNNVQTRSMIAKRFSLVAPAIVECHHRCSVSQSSNGFGFTGGFGKPEVYTILDIERTGDA